MTCSEADDDENVKPKQSSENINSHGRFVSVCNRALKKGASSMVDEGRIQPS